MVVGLTGYMHSGKDIVADELVRSFNFKKYSFAYPIKEMAKIMFGWGNDHMTGRLKEREDDFWGISPRQVLQLIGTEFGQYMLSEKSQRFKEITGRKIWVRRFIIEVNRLENMNVDWVISDVRFPHEVEELRYHLSAKIVRINRDSAVPDMANLHESEAHIKDIAPDYEFFNNDSISSIKEKVKDMMSTLSLDKNWK